MIKKNNLVVITTKSIVRRSEVSKVCNDILQVLGGDGMTLFELGCTYDSLSDEEYKEFLAGYQFLENKK